MCHDLVAQTNWTGAVVASGKLGKVSTSNLDTDVVSNYNDLKVNDR